MVIFFDVEKIVMKVYAEFSTSAKSREGLNYFSRSVSTSVKHSVKSSEMCAQVGQVYWQLLIQILSAGNR